MVFVVHGVILLDGISFGNGETWHGEDEVAVRAGDSGATIWRWDLTKAPAASFASAGLRSLVKLSAPPPDPALRAACSCAATALLSCPAAAPLTHVHQGPQASAADRRRWHTHRHGRGALTAFGPGGAWFESGPEEVFAQAAPNRPSRFVRAMILPIALVGKNSIRYVNEADKGKPHSQSYVRFFDVPIAFRS
jgi:hypothetical protein